MNGKRIFGIITGLVLALSAVCAQNNLEDTVSPSDGAASRSAASGFAEEEFRRGVQSYYRGAFNEAILEFEKALSYLPGENLILEWLGKAYYRSGIEGAALQQWQYASEQGYGGLLLQNKIEIVGDRRIIRDDGNVLQRYTEAGSFANVFGTNLLFSQPTSVLCNDDGTFWVTAYGSNEIILFDSNGLILQHYKGPLNGFDRPMDIIRLKDGNMLVSEAAGNRLALLNAKGLFIKYIGSKGLGDGQLIGPQYIAQDSNGNIFVTDYGNSRVVVFDAEGNSLFTFGKKTDGFSGLYSPTGIAVSGNNVYVADSVKGAIYQFDTAGNYIGLLVAEHTLSRPEALEVDGQYIIATDKNRIVSIDTSNGATYTNAATGNGSSSITCAVPDKNGNFLVTDFKASEIYVMSKTSELVGGLFVQIERINSDNFPQVTMDVRVENRNRQQVIGLNDTNFFVTENKNAVQNMQIVGVGNSNDFADLTIVIDRSSGMELYEEQVDSAVREITAAMNGKGRVQIISAGAVPNIEYTGEADRLSTFSVSSLKCAYTDDVSLDLGLRLAANNLINGEKKRGIIYLTSGTIGGRAFNQYGLSDIAAYLNNNSISLSTVMVNQGSLCEELSFLTENTEGDSYYVYRPEGISSIVKDIISIPSGLYQISYTSSLSTEYGRKYLPVEVETYILNRSGRDECGYFAPLE